jgi:ABC-type phosphate transport system substrate-binding protein
MRSVKKVPALLVAAATLAALTAGPAWADPPPGVTPRVTDAVSTGSDTTQYLLDQLSTDFNSAHSGATTDLYSWDAVNPYTLAIGDSIVTKAGCAAIDRPDGSGAGIDALEANAQPSGNTTNYCVDYARSSRARESTDPACGTGGICFVSLAGDAVTWAARDSSSGGTDAPTTLTQQDLVNIYECTWTNWDQVPGDHNDAAIQAYLPQTSSGTRAFFLTALGGGTTPITPGACVSDLPTETDPDGTLEENEGINPVYDSPEAIGIFSVGSYISQAYRSAVCTNNSPTECSPSSSPNTFPCSPVAGQNAFGCDEVGYLGLGLINKSDPPMTVSLEIDIEITPGTASGTTNVDLPVQPAGQTFGPAPWKLDSFTSSSGITGQLTGKGDLQITAADSVAAGHYKATGDLTDAYGNELPFDVTITVTVSGSKTETEHTVPIINGASPILFQRTLFDVVRYDPNTADHIPGPEAGAPGGINLEQFFAAKDAAVPGWICSSSKAQTDIKDYGFLPHWKLSTCGTVG